ncbi:MAG: sigma-70 family RNA polymerase sigma factor [Solobacterium sp.]|nr:sigma-70 family RNA polymerase sigma factor [Solobacterium sp.]
MEDNGIIELYFARDESAISETAAKYGHYCYTVAWNILFSHEDSQECVNDTWRKTWELIPPQRPNLLKFFLAKITRGFAMNVLRGRTRQKRGGTQYETALEELENVLHSASDPQSEFDTKLLAQEVNRFLGTLKEKDRNVFVRRYFYLEAGSKIAERYGLSEANVNVILNRTRNRLKEHLRKEGWL